VRVLSRLFRGKFLSLLAGAFRQEQLAFHGRLEHLADAAAFGELADELRQREWVVYAKPPFGGPEQVLKYLARYTHRVAISNQRLVELENGQVHFRWKDYAHGNSSKVMALDAIEFIRRFLLHVVPAGLVHIRHYGLLANRHREEKLTLCRQLLGCSGQPPVEPAAATEEKSEGAAGARQRCPVCHEGRMVIVEALEPQRQQTRSRAASRLPEEDTS
jgi:Putative transposase